jgi:triacylglycerol lipase
MIVDTPISSEKLSTVVGLEAIATAATLLLYPFGIRRQKKRTARRANQQTTVFIHGYLGNRSTFLPMRGYLQAHGMRGFLSFEYSARDSIERAAQDLKEFLRKNVRGGRINLVCHSLGGVVARFFMQELGGARRVDHCITIGTPHRGTYSAYWMPSNIGRALRPDSTTMARLNASRANAQQVRFLSIAGGSDNIIVPRVFSAMDEDLVHFPNLGHLGMLFSPQVCRVVADRLQSLPTGPAISRIF